MVTDIELASVKLVEKFCRRSEGQYVELAMQPYAPRAFPFLELLRVGHWRMKLYGIAYREDLPRESLLASAREIARARPIVERNSKQLTESDLLVFRRCRGLATG